MPENNDILQAVLLEDYDRNWSNLLGEKNYADHINRHRDNRLRFYKAIEKYLAQKAGQKVLELGCGTGIDLNIVANENPNAICFGSDISQKSILISVEISKLFGNDTQYFVADTRYIPLKSGSFDLVFSQGLVEHFKEPLHVLKEQARTLKMGGILIVNVPQRFTGYTVVKKVLIKRGKWQLGWELEFSYGDLRKIGHKLDLKQREVFGYQYWRSWMEPLFVLRDLYNKLDRRNPLHHRQPFPTMKRVYDSLWKHFENRLGHYFLQNIVIVFEKKIP